MLQHILVQPSDREQKFSSNNHHSESENSVRGLASRESIRFCYNFINASTCYSISVMFHEKVALVLCYLDSTNVEVASGIMHICMSE